MTTFLRRHPVAAFAGALVLLAAVGIGLAPLWIDLAPVRARIERAASTALAGTLTYERIDLSWFPRTEVVVRSVKVDVPGVVRGTVGTARVSPALWPLLRGRVELTKLRVDGLDMALIVGPSKVPEAAPASSPDWRQALSSLGSRTLDVELGRSRVALSRPAGKSITLEGLRLEASLRAAEGRLDVALSRLSSESPKLALAGTLRADGSAPRVEVSARGSGLDVTDVRAKLLAFAGDDPLIAAIFAIFRGGTLTSFSFASAGKSPEELGVLERMTIRAAVKDAKVRIEGPGLDLEGVAADVTLEGGALSAKDAVARLGGSRASAGSVLVGLARGDERLRVEADVQAHLAEVPAILARAVPNASLRQELALVESLAGSATGRLTIGDRKNALETRVDLPKMRFSATYKRLPWPVDVRGGRFSFDGKSVGVSEMAGSLGRSTFEGLAARVRLGERPTLESGSGSLDVALEDFLEGVRTKQGADVLARNVRRLTGSLHVDLRRVSGPLARLDEASVSASGTFKEILFSSSSSSSSLPPLSIASGRFTVSDDAIRVEDVDARTLDASLRVSGAWSGYRKGAGTVEAAADGELGPEAIRWTWAKASLPAGFRPAAPVAFRGLRVSAAPKGTLSLAGGFVVARGPRVTLDLARESGRTDLRDLTIVDGATRASFTLGAADGALDARFRGTLDVGTIERIFAERPLRRGTIEGDVRMTAPAKRPLSPSVEGTLTVSGLEVPTPAGPVTVERLEARASGSRVDVGASSIVLDEQRISVKGSAAFRDDAVTLDMDVGTGDLAWTRVEKVLGRLEEAKKEKAGREDSMNKKAVTAQPAPEAQVAIAGDLRVSLDSFTHGNFVFKPVLADVRFGKGAVRATVKKGDLCGIATTGEARLLPDGALSVDARANAAGPDINVPLTCLGFENVRMTGAYEASVQASGEGPASALVRTLRGPIAFKATKGRIGKATLLTRILGVVNATEVFSGKDKTRVGDATPYEAITVEGELAEGTVSIREAALKAPSITMAATGTVGLLGEKPLDLMVLSHPLSTVDKVVQAVPVVRNILGRNFLAVAVKVTGTVGDPVAKVTPGRDVGRGLVGILERTVTLPVTVFEPRETERK